MKEKLLELLWDLDSYKYPDYDKKADEILLLFSAVGQREQLKAFAEYLDEIHGGEEFAVNEIDNYIKSL